MKGSETVLMLVAMVIVAALAAGVAWQQATKRTDAVRKRCDERFATVFGSLDRIRDDLRDDLRDDRSDHSGKWWCSSQCAREKATCEAAAMKGTPCALTRIAFCGSGRCFSDYDACVVMGYPDKPCIGVE